MSEFRLDCELTQIKVPLDRAVIIKMEFRAQSSLTTERGMFFLRTPQGRTGWQRAAGAARAAGGRLARTVLIAIMLILMTFAAVAPSHACPSGASPSARVTKSGQNTVRMAKSHGAMVRTAVVSSAGESTAKSTACCGRGAGHGSACAGTCCPACVAGVIAPDWTVTRAFALHFEFPSVEPDLPSVQSDRQFRPPRLAV
jgi:hypothetical protein